MLQLNTPGIAPNSAVVELPTNVIEASNQISAKCAAQQGNKFTITVRGGLPENPTAKLTRMILWTDLRVPESTSGELITENTASVSPIIEATGFAIDKFGQVELVAVKTKSFDNLQQMPDYGEL